MFALWLIGCKVRAQDWGHIKPILLHYKSTAWFLACLGQKHGNLAKCSPEGLPGCPHLVLLTLYSCSVETVVFRQLIYKPGIKLKFMSHVIDLKYQATFWLLSFLFWLLLVYCTCWKSSFVQFIKTSSSVQSSFEYICFHYLFFLLQTQHGQDRSGQWLWLLYSKTRP